MNSYLAIYIGIHTARAYISSLKDSKITLQQIYSFSNLTYTENNIRYWDIKYIYSEIINILKTCKALDIYPESMGITAAGHDYILLDKNNELLCPCEYLWHEDTLESNVELKETIYYRSGMELSSMNIIEKLMQDPFVKDAESFLTIADYLNFLLTGKIYNEYSLCSSTGLVRCTKQIWDTILIRKLGIKNIFKNITMPGKYVGNLKTDIREEIGMDIHVILVASSSVASAVTGLPLDENTAFSVVWHHTITGVERISPIIRKEDYNNKVSNYGGVEYRFRYAKVNQGFQLFDNLYNSKDHQSMSLHEMMNLAKESTTEEIYDPVIHTEINPDTVRSIYNLLAKQVKEDLDYIEASTGKSYSSLVLLSHYDADNTFSKIVESKTGKKIIVAYFASEIYGNLVIQLMSNLQISLQSARKFLPY